MKGEGFTGWCDFSRREQGRDAKPGDIYDINMYGPENGSVVLRDKQSDRFTVSTVNGPPYGEHPIYGNREFGFEKNDDGSTTFYTRAADRRDFLSGQTPAGALVAGPAQNATWRNWTADVERRLNDMGGNVRPGSRTESWEMQ